MKRRLWHAIGVALSLFVLQATMTSCASSEEGADAEEAVNASGEEGQSQDANAQAESTNGDAAQGEEVANAQAAEGNVVAEGDPSQAAAGDAAAGEQPIAETAPSGSQGDLQEIIDEMNQGGEAAPAANAALAQAAPVNAAAESSATPVAAAPVAATPSGAPGPAGLPEMGSKMAYIVQKGDTLGKIAAKVYGDPAKWSEIQSFTNLTNPRLIYPGDVVYYQLTEKTSAFATTYEGLPRSEVQVQQGDTLSTIAGRVLGSSANWKLIWRQNDGISNPDQLTAGTTLYYIAPGALSASVNDLKSQIATSQRHLVRVIAESVKASQDSSASELNPAPASTDLPNSVEDELSSDSLSGNITAQIIRHV